MGTGKQESPRSGRSGAFLWVGAGSGRELASGWLLAHVLVVRPGHVGHLLELGQSLRSPRRPLPNVVRWSPRTVQRPGSFGRPCRSDRSAGFDDASFAHNCHARTGRRGPVGRNGGTGRVSGQRNGLASAAGGTAQAPCASSGLRRRGVRLQGPEPRPRVRIREPRVICVQSGRLHGDGDPETPDRRTDECSNSHHPSLTSAGHNTAGRRLDDLPSRSRAPALLLLDLRTGREARTGTGTRKGRVMTPSAAGTNAKKVREGRRMASSLRCEAHDQSHGWITEQVRPPRRGSKSRRRPSTRSGM